MTYNLYSVRDLKLNYGPVFCAANDDLAKRQFGYMLQDKPLCDYPQDFELYRVGGFDPADASIWDEEKYCVMTGGQADAI